MKNFYPLIISDLAGVPVPVIVRNFRFRIKRQKIGIFYETIVFRVWFPNPGKFRWDPALDRSPDVLFGGQGQGAKDQQNVRIIIIYSIQSIPVFSGFYRFINYVENLHFFSFFSFFFLDPKKELQKKKKNSTLKSEDETKLFFFFNRKKIFLQIRRLSNFHQTKNHKTEKNLVCLTVLNKKIFHSMFVFALGQ